MTVFDPGTLHRLGDGGDCRAFVLDLAHTYRRLLPARVERLLGAVGGVGAPDVDTAMDAALSLKVTSTMIGALELAELAAVVEMALRRRDVPAVRARACEVTAAAHRARDAIGDYLAGQLTGQLAGQLAGQVPTDSIR